MTELEKALYADAMWLLKRLDELRAHPSNTLINRVYVLSAVKELRATTDKYVGDGV